MAQCYELDDQALHDALSRQPQLCGIDEAGRGALAGPVVAAAVVLTAPAPEGLTDSKAISARRREKLFDQLQSVALIGVGVVGAEVIDRVNILQANFMAMQSALESVLGQVAAGAAPGINLVLVDGNYLTQGIQRLCAESGTRIGTVVKGDAKVVAISAASVIAKVTRDRLMQAAEVSHPGYSFAINAGYPSPTHLASLKALGACGLHRKTFGPVAKVLAAA